MTERKPWTQDEDMKLRELTSDGRYGTGQKLRWGEIALQLEKVGSRRTGKQCRERWHNQLKPGIDNERGWSTQQQKILFRSQEQHGNRWAQIAKELPGRTDNNIKNYFYSTLRKALRKVNAFVSTHKKEPRYRNVKEFKPQTLSKILAVAQSKYQQKINLKRSGVVTDAKVIKKCLVQIQLDEEIDPTMEKCQVLERAVDFILEFNRNCKRRKGKKKDQEDEQIDGDNQSDESVEKEKPSDVKRSPEKEKRSLVKREKRAVKKEDNDEMVDIVDQVVLPMVEVSMEIKVQRSGQVAESGKISGDRNGRSSSSGNNISCFLQKSSSFNKCQPAHISLPDNPSHDYSTNKMENQTVNGLRYLNSIPSYEARRSDEVMGSEFFRETHNHSNIHSIALIESKMFSQFDEDAFRLSASYGNGTDFMRRKMTSRCEKSMQEDEGQ